MWTGIIYGSDALNTESFPLKTTIESLATLSTALITIAGLNPTIEFVGDEIEYNNGMLEGANHYRYSFELRIKYKRFPKTVTSLQDFLQLEPLKKKYKWIYLNNYPLVPNEIKNNSNKCLPISIGGYQINESDGWKEIILSMKSRDIDV